MNRKDIQISFNATHIIPYFKNMSSKKCILIQFNLGNGGNQPFLKKDLIQNLPDRGIFCKIREAVLLRNTPVGVANPPPPYPLWECCAVGTLSCGGKHDLEGLETMLRTNDRIEQDRPDLRNIDLLTMREVARIRSPWKRPTTGALGHGWREAQRVLFDIVNAFDRA